MEISKHSIVTIDYKLTNTDGEVLDTSEGKEPLAYLHGVGSIVPGLEDALAGHVEGDELRVKVPPERGYGERDEGLVGTVTRAQIGLEANLEVGMLLQVMGENDQTEIVRIANIEDDDVTLDGNHPLAGETLVFEVQIVGVRAASKDEIEHGHAHGDGHAHGHGDGDGDGDGGGDGDKDKEVE